MSKLSNTLCITTSITLAFVSCATLKSSRSSDKAATESAYIIDPLELSDSLSSTDTAPIDSLAYEVEEVDSLVCAIEADSMAQDSVVIDNPMPIEEAHEVFHFEGKETSAVMIDEFRNTVVEDINLDLRTESKHYPADGYVTSNYGWRRGRMHAGVDLKAYTGDPLYATFDGVVRLSKYYGSFGNCIIIRHYNGLETLYAHASKRLVEVNDEVKAGDVIAYAGNTGRSTGSHLHFEVRAGGHYLNPSLVLDTKNRQIKDTSLFITMRNGRLFASNNESEEEREAYILQQLSIKYHVVRRGDNLSTIAVNNRTTVTNICRLNGISSKSILRIGQRLIVRDGIKPPVAKKSAPTPTTASAAKSSASNSQSSSIVYKVRKGDNLSTIAKRHGTSVTAICNLNNITSRSTLQIGQNLRIPSNGAASTSSTSSSPEYYRIKSGDTLSGIAQRYNTTVSALCRLNGISSRSTLQINQRLRVR